MELYTIADRIERILRKEAMMTDDVKCTVCGSYVACCVGEDEPLCVECAYDELTRLREELKEWEASFELYDAAMKDATEYFKKNNPGFDGLPDTRKMWQWYIDRVKELEGAITAAGKRLGTRTICPECQQAAVEHDIVDLVHLVERKP